METLALFLLCGVILVSVVGSIWMLIAAARVSVLWFLAVFFIPGAIFVFAARHWDVAKKPFLLTAGPALLGIGAAILIPNLVADREQAAESGSRNPPRHCGRPRPRRRAPSSRVARRETWRSAFCGVTPRRPVRPTPC
jgi:hypothetical protein